MITDPKVSRPGDPDLDIDLYNVVITECVQADQHFILEYTASDGEFRVSASSDETHVGQKRAVDHITGTATFGFAPDRQTDYVAHVRKTLDQWAADGTELRLCSAPGRGAQLFDPATGTWVLLPRSPAGS